MKKKVGICTLFTGYNFGSSLQAYATKTVLDNLNYNGEIIKLSGSVVKGRDIRIKKLIVMLFRTLLYSKNIKKVIKSYSQNNKGNKNPNIIKKFDIFNSKYLKPIELNYKKLKKVSKDSEYYAFICGSDQIWNSTTYYVDPFYYLQFAPRKKRIAYAPSFGREFIPKYNKRIIKKYLDGFDKLSVREDSAKDIIKKLTNKDVITCLDPTLLLSKEEWMNIFNLIEDNSSKYILVYFLNEPSSLAQKIINSFEKKYKVIYINNDINKNNVNCGPIEFLKYMLNAKCILTDSFHGLAFSINFNKDFYAFDRKYVTDNQSTRLRSLLAKLQLDDRFIENEHFTYKSIDYKNANKLLIKERDKSISFLKNSLQCNEVIE